MYIITRPLYIARHIISMEYYIWYAHHYVCIGMFDNKHDLTCVDVIFTKKKIETAPKA